MIIFRSSCYRNCFLSQKSAWLIDSTSSYKKIRFSVMLLNIRILFLWMSMCFVFCDRAIHLIWIWSNHADSEWKDRLREQMRRDLELQSTKHDSNVDIKNYLRIAFRNESSVYLVTFNESSSWTRTTSIEKIEKMMKMMMMNDFFEMQIFDEII
jgi:hypothetical protein